MPTAVSRAEQREDVFSEKIARLLPIRRFGWAFLLAWVFCVFYTEVVEGYTGSLGLPLISEGLMGQLFFSGMPVLMSVVMLVIIVAGESRFGSPTSHRSLFWIAPVATALSTPLLFWSAGDGVFTVVLFAAGAILTGFGSGLMWVMWGEYYVRISQEDAELIAPVSAIIAAVLVLLVSAMNGWVALVVVGLFPICSGLCFFLSWKDVSLQVASAERAGVSEIQSFSDAHDRAKRSPFDTLKTMGRASLGIVVACLFVCLEGSFWAGSDKQSFAFQIVLLISIVFVAAVAFASTVGPRRISIAFLYRWMCPALVLGFVALIMFGPALGGYCAFVVSIAARFAFCLITQMYFARFAEAGAATAVQSFGLGWIFVHLGDFLGIVLLINVDSALGMGSISLDQVAALSIAVLVVVTMFVLNSQKSFVADASSDALSGASRASVSEVTARVSDDQSVDELAEAIGALAKKHELTPRETEVFELLARGRSVPYIRDALVISRETAATHAKHIYVKLEVHSRQELIDLVH